MMPSIKPHQSHTFLKHLFCVSNSTSIVGLGIGAALQVAKLAKGEVLMLNIGSMCTGARVIAVKHDLSKLQLTSPVCTKEGEKVALSRCG